MALLTVILNRDRAWFQNPIDSFQAITPSLLPSTAGVADTGVSFYAYGVIVFNDFCGSISYGWRQEMTVNSLS